MQRGQEVRLPIPWVPIVNTVLAEIVNVLFSQFVENTFHYTTPTAKTQGWLDGLADVFKQWNAGTLFPHLSQRIANSHVRVSDAYAQNGLSSIRVQTSNSGGVAEGTGLPGGVALAIKKVTPQRGRSFRGRLYVPGVPASALASGDADTVTSTFMSAMLTDMAALITALNAYDANGALSVGSKFSGGVVRTPYGLATTITAFTVNDKVDSQRRRLYGRGT